MRKLLALVSFVLGFAILALAFGIGYADWWGFTSRNIVMQALMGALVIIILFLAAVATLGDGKDRWRTLILASVLLLGLSALVIFSVGWMVAPFALLLFVFSLLKLLRTTELVLK